MLLDYYGWATGCKLGCVFICLFRRKLVMAPTPFCCEEQCFLPRLVAWVPPIETILRLGITVASFGRFVLI